jgi:phage FluMu protein Com
VELGAVAPGSTTCVSGVRQERSFDVECPHCHKSFAAEPIEGGRAARYLGFKCPHCKLFVPLQRAALSRDTSA